MTRIIVHAGFHKTGTTSLQHYFSAHRDVFKQWFDYYGQNDFKSAGSRARIYAQKPFFWRRMRWRSAMKAFLASVPDADCIVLSRETFCGVMPGHRDWRGRVIQDFKTAGIPLCKDLIALLRGRFGQNAQIDFLFTTRAQEPWIKSVYGHLLRSIHLTTEFEEFRADFPNLIDLREEAIEMANALEPLGVTVTQMALEDFRNAPQGPATAIFAMLKLDAKDLEHLPKSKRANLRQSAELEAVFLRLNRSGKLKSELKKIKDELRAAEGENQ